MKVWTNDGKIHRFSAVRTFDFTDSYLFIFTDDSKSEIFATFPLANVTRWGQ